MLEKLPESIGHALINQRAGMENVVYNTLYHARLTAPSSDGRPQPARMDLRSSAFVFNARLPDRYTADGAGLSPPLEWSQVPETSESLVMIVEDADSPTPHPLVHAIVTGLPGRSGSLDEGALDTGGAGAATSEGLGIGLNSFLQHAWLPPDPPRGHGIHRYVFQLFALHAGKPLSAAPGRGELVDAIVERAVGVGCLIGTYERSVRQDADVTTGADPGIEMVGLKSGLAPA